MRVWREEAADRPKRQGLVHALKILAEDQGVTYVERRRGQPGWRRSKRGPGPAAGLILEKAAVASFVRASPASFLSASKVGWSMVGRNGIPTGGADSSLTLTSSLSVVTRTAGGSSRYAAGPTWANPAGI